MQTATEASSIASKLSRVVRFDPVKLVQKLVQKCIIQSPQSGNFCFDWLGLGMESAVAFSSLPEYSSFLAGPLDSAPLPSPPLSPPISPPLPPPPPITIIDNLSSRCRCRAHLTAFTNARDTSHRGRTDQSHRQYHLSLPRPSQQTTGTPNPGDTRHRCRTDHFHSQHLL
jgi:hypothetical protein